MENNKCIFIGRLNEKEMRYLPNGQGMIKIVVGVEMSFKLPDGKYAKKMQLINMTAFGELAESINENYKVGSFVRVESQYSTSVRSSGGGKPIVFHNFTVRNIERVSRKQDEEENGDWEENETSGPPPF